MSDLLAAFCLGIGIAWVFDFRERARWIICAVCATAMIALLVAGK